MRWRRFRSGGVVATVLAAACGGGAAAACGGASELPPVPVAGAVPAVEESAGERWHATRRAAADDDGSDVVVYRGAGSVTGTASVVLYARCTADRTEVEIDLGVRLGDDVIDDGEIATKRVVVRFVPERAETVVYTVGAGGDSLLVDRPVWFLRDLVASEALLVQTVSALGTTVFGGFEITPLAYETMRAVSSECGWILDRDAVLEAERRDREALREAERAELLSTYVGQPLRDGIERYGVEFDELFLDLPAPVGRAYLGFGVTVSDIEAALAWGEGIVCLAGAWVGDQIELSECHVESEIAGPGDDDGGEPGADPGRI